MYDKYTTDALILSAKDFSENDRMLALFTREFGLVWARVGAVRKESSKMRSALQNYSRAQVSLIKGKTGWRAGGAVAESDSREWPRESLPSYARLGLLVTRLVHGEERNDFLFESISAARSRLRASAEMSSIIELLSVARILFALGYISPEALKSSLFSHSSISEEDIVEAERLHDTLLSTVNESLTTTML